MQSKIHKILINIDILLASVHWRRLLPLNRTAALQPDCNLFYYATLTGIKMTETQRVPSRNYKNDCGRRENDQRFAKWKCSRNNVESTGT